MFAVFGDEMSGGGLSCNWAVLLGMRTLGLLFHPSNLSLAPDAPVTGRSALHDSLCKPSALSPQGPGLGCVWAGGGE